MVKHTIHKTYIKPPTVNGMQKVVLRYFAPTKGERFYNAFERLFLFHVFNAFFSNVFYIHDLLTTFGSFM